MTRFRQFIFPRIYVVYINDDHDMMMMMMMICRLVNQTEYYEAKQKINHCTVSFSL